MMLLEFAFSVLLMLLKGIRKVEEEEGENAYPGINN